MARTVKDAKLQNRTNRLQLDERKFHWRGISQGLAIGYRRGKSGASWYVRTATGKGNYVSEVLGNADDYQDANGIDVLSFDQAQAKAREVADEIAKRKAGQRGPYTVDMALDDYLEWFKAERRSYAKTDSVIKKSIRPKLGDKELSALTPETIRRWRDGLVKHDDEAEVLRKRRASANRVLTILKAALNHAWRSGKIATDEAWRVVSPFRHVDAPKIRFLSADEAQRLINASDADFRQLVRGALYTGARYGELIAATVADFHPDAPALLLRYTKNGKHRFVPLTDEGRAFFERLCVDRADGDKLFTREDGQPWGPSQQVRRMNETCGRAGIDPAASFHDLRHTYASQLAMRGTPLQVIAAALGHSDTRITERHYAHLLPSYVSDTIRATLPDLGKHDSDNVVMLKR